MSERNYPMEAWRDIAHSRGRKIEELERQITAYQIAKDNLELRLHKSLVREESIYFPTEAPKLFEPRQVY